MKVARIWLAALLAAFLTFGASASARHEPVSDPKDTRGRLDVSTVRLRHDEGPPQWRVVTFARWSIAQIWDVGFFVVELDTTKNEGVDYRVVVRSDGRRLHGTLYRVRRDGTTRALASMAAGKAGSRAMAVRVPLAKLSIGANRSVYRWSVLTLFGGAGCSRTCIDRVPDAGVVDQPLPGVTPSPTPTPTPSP
jgi:hypothetical protein